ncbi:MAG: hypothetical protein R2792_16095 [Saprospiraceae bacterium]
MRLFCLICLLAGLASCNSADTQWNKLKADFVALIPQDSVYLLAEGPDTLHLTLPPNIPQQVNWKTEFEALRSRLGSLDTQAIQSDQRVRWEQMCRILDSLQSRPYPAFNQMGNYCLGNLLLHFTSDRKTIRYPGLMVALVEQMPNYYDAVQQRWSPANQADIEWAVTDNLTALDQLDKLEAYSDRLSIGYKERLQKALPAARLAIKDFLARCQSTWLESSGSML